MSIFTKHSTRYQVSVASARRLPLAVSQWRARADLTSCVTPSQQQHLPAVSILGCLSNGYSPRKVGLQHGTANQTLFSMPQIEHSPASGL